MSTRIFLISILCSIAGFLAAQTEYVTVDSITVLGNKKTKEQIIIREMGISTGDQIPLTELEARLKQSELFLMNTGMFSRASIYFKNWQGATNRIHLVTEVEEAWYLYPVPIFELADRNFNVWWVEQNRSLQRVNYGLDFTNLNFTGRMDRLKVGLKTGYTRSFFLRYSLPYINAAQTLGLTVTSKFSQNREVNYATIGNKQEFFRDEDNFVYNRFYSDFALIYRPRIRSYHQFNFIFHQNQIDDVIANELNPDFFLNQRRTQRYFTFNYTYTYDNRDIRPYPINGNYFSTTLEKDGLGVYSDRNALTFYLLYNQYLPLSDKWSAALETSTKFSILRNQQPYNDNRALGFGIYNMHGYEYYIVDGLDLGILRTSFRRLLFNRELNFGRLVPIPAYRRMPLKLYLSLNNDFGYVNDPFDEGFNSMNNRLLWGGGLGLDFVIYYDKVFRIEYSVNHLKEGGLFLHFDLGI